MPTFDCPTLVTFRCVLAAAALAGAAALAPAYAQSPALDPVARAPQLPSLVDSLVTVTVGRLDPGQTVTQNFTPNPVPSGGVMSVNGEWPVAVVGGGEGQVNRKIRAVLRSPGGQIVADGCGFARDAKPTSAGFDDQAGAVGGRPVPGQRPGCRWRLERRRQLLRWRWGATVGAVPRARRHQDPRQLPGGPLIAGAA